MSPCLSIGSFALRKWLQRHFVLPPMARKNLGSHPRDPREGSRGLWVDDHRETAYFQTNPDWCPVLEIPMNMDGLIIPKGPFKGQGLQSKVLTMV